MPSDTEKQARFMAACHHGAGYESCPPAKVSAEFNEADKGTAMLSNAMKHRVRRPMGGPVNTGMQRLPPNLLAMLQARAAPNLPGGMPGGGGMPPGGISPHFFPGMRPVMPTPGAGASPPMMTGGQGMPMTGAPAPQPPPSALGALQQNQGPMVRPPMPTGPIGPPAGGMPNPTGMARPFVAMRARGGGIAPPGMGPSPLPPPTSPLSSLIGGGMAAMHGGPGLAPHMRKPRIPLPGALRNINQTINRSRQKLGQMGPV